MTQKIKTLFAFVLFFISSLALFATFYTIYIWGDIYFEQILVALDDGTAAVGDNIVNSYVYFTFIPAAILTFVVILFVNSNRLLFILSFIFLIFSLYRTSFFEYLIHETPPAYAGGIILGQAKLVLNLRVPDILYSVVSLPH